MPRFERLLGRTGAAALSICLVPVLAAAVYFLPPGRRPASGSPPSAPVTIRPPDPLPLAASDRARWAPVLAKFRPTLRSEPSVIGHYLRLQACRAAADPALVARLVDDEFCRDPLRPGESILIPRPGGIRHRLKVAASTAGAPPLWPGEAHPGQCLSALAEAGVPPDTEVRLGTRAYRVEDLIRETAWSFTFDEEIEWRSLALVLYQPQVRHWPTKYGVEMSWTAVTREFLRRCRDLPSKELACSGTHTLYLLALMGLVDDARPIWSRDEKAAVERCLRDATGRLARTQQPDGSWDELWAAPGDSQAAPDPPAKHVNLLITGHHLEWLALRPRGGRPAEEVVARAGGYVLRSLEGMEGEEINQFICHCSHGVRAFRVAGIAPDRPSR